MSMARSTLFAPKTHPSGHQNQASEAIFRYEWVTRGVKKPHVRWPARPIGSKSMAYVNVDHRGRHRATTTIQRERQCLSDHGGVAEGSSRQVGKCVWIKQRTQ